MDTWAQEYTLGCGKEIYRAKLSPYFSGKTFSEMANLVFSHLGVCVLAVEIMDTFGVPRAVLFPPKYEIPSSSTFVFLIGEDVSDAHLVSSFNLQDGVLEVHASHTYSHFAYSQTHILTYSLPPSLANTHTSVRCPSWWERWR
jgi:hypothetical protein